MSVLLAVDPGDVHVGLALFTYGPDADGDEAADCTRAWETDPATAIDLIASWLLNYQIDTLVVEEFRLYPGKAKQLTGSTMPTCELIGQIKWAHRLDARRRRDLVCDAGDTMDRLDDAGKTRIKAYREAAAEVGRNAGVDLILQPAAIQEPTTGLLRRRGIKSVAKAARAAIREAGGEGDHALSAELHGWCWLLRRAGDPITRPQL